MVKILKSKWFVIITTLIALTLTIVSGILLGYEPSVTGSGGMSNGYGAVKVTTEYVFSWKIAVGYWCIGLIITIAVCLICILIRKAYSEPKESKAD